jgi:HlyD family secretion protein
MKKRIAQGLFGLLAAGFLALAVWHFLPAPFEVELAEAQSGAISLVVSEDAVVRARDRYAVAAPVSARLLPVAPERGTRVRAGTHLARLSPLPLAAMEREEAVTRLRAAQARAAEAADEVERARAAMEQAQREELRTAEFLGSGAPSRAQHDEAKVALVRAQAQARAAAFRADAAAGDVRVAELALQLSEDSGRVLDIHAPVEGVVTKVFETKDRVVPAGTPLLELSDTTRLEVVMSVLSEAAAKITPGMSVLVDKWGGDKPLRLSVREVESTVTTRVGANGVAEERVNVIADLINGPAHLTDGQPVAASVVLAHKANALKVPAAALVAQGSASSVFAVVGDQARRVAVVTGLRASAEVEVLSGLEVGARVVVHPPANLKDGARVVARPGATIK